MASAGFCQLNAPNNESADECFLLSGVSPISITKTVAEWPATAAEEAWPGCSTWLNISDLSKLANSQLDLLMAHCLKEHVRRMKQ